MLPIVHRVRYNHCHPKASTGWSIYLARFEGESASSARFRWPLRGDEYSGERDAVVDFDEGEASADEEIGVDGICRPYVPRSRV